MGKLSKQKAPNQILIKDFDWNSDWLYIVVVKKMFRYSNVFFYNHLYRNSVFRKKTMESGIKTNDKNVMRQSGRQSIRGGNYGNK